MLKARPFANIRKNVAHVKAYAQQKDHGNFPQKFSQLYKHHTDTTGCII
jgi:hypothetical protein